MLGPRQIPALALVVAIGGCGGDDDGGGEQSSDLPEGCIEVEAPAAKQGEFTKPEKRLSGPASAVVQTNCGAFTIELDTERAPLTTSSFAGLVDQGLYDGTLFHRIEPGFVVQGGDPNGDGTGGPGYFVDEKPPQDLSYTKATVAMAKTSAEPPGRSGSQFFVVTAPADAGLPPEYALVGKVDNGYDVVAGIGKLGTPAEKPKQTVLIEEISIEQGY
ncbi:MAG: peptidylprolyl isomerase [Solirubrobacterales bacterium]